MNTENHLYTLIIFAAAWPSLALLGERVGERVGERFIGSDIVQTQV